MRKYMCNEAGCGALLDKPGYCDKHRRAKAERPARPFENAARSNYYGSPRWKAMAKQAVHDTPYCEICGISKADGATLEVHHREPPRGDEDKFFDGDNLQVLCGLCHRVVTAREIQERNRRRKALNR
jgi:5-methylcytosine-specific restriction protein A